LPANNGVFILVVLGALAADPLAFVLLIVLLTDELRLALLEVLFINDGLFVSSRAKLDVRDMTLDSFPGLSMMI
jgi:hypothetical protein